MSTIQLRPRATAALAVVATSLFLLLCLANYGAGGFADAADPAFHLRIAGWFVEVFGAGAFVLVLMPLVWGVVVYFHEATPDLRTRAFGTVLLAASVSLIAGLLQGADAGLWTGGIGVVGVWLVGALDAILWAAIAHTIVWTLSLALFVVSLVWATDWMFHTLRRGAERPAAVGSHDLPTEETLVELRDPEETPSVDREFVTHTTEAAAVAEQIPTFEERPAVGSDTVPPGFSAREQSGRVLLRGPSGYAGVEFLPTSNNLAVPHEPESIAAPEFDQVFEIYDEPLVAMIEEPQRAAIAADLPAAAEGAEIAEREEPAPPPDAPNPYAAEADALGTEVLAEEVLAEEAPAEEAPAEETLAEQTLSEESVAPEPASAAEPTVVSDEIERPRTGIGFPEDSPFLDEVFTVGVLVDDVIGPAATHPAEIEHRDESVTREVADETSSEAAPAWAAEEAVPRVLDDEFLVDEVFETPVAYAVVDDLELPAPIRQRTATPAVAPAQEPEAAATAPALPPTEGRLPFGGEPEIAAPAASNDLDARFDEAVEAVLDRGRASAMVLQRVMGIGHARGLRILRQMEDLGVVGPESGTGTRQILVTREEWSAAAG